MLIDWFTVCAQTLNFLVLVWLMKRYLYKPILDAIDTREKLVAKELAEADANKAEAKKERDEFQLKNDEFDKNRVVLQSKAIDEAKAERKRLFDEARKAADELSTTRHEALESETRQLKQAVRHRTQQEVFAITRKTLTDLASAGLEEQMSEVFIRRLRAMETKAKEQLREGLKTPTGPVIVHSTFELPTKQRTAIQDALHEALSSTAEIRFETSPDLVGGIEAIVGGRKIAWSIADYLESLERSVGELVGEKTEAVVKPAATKPKAMAVSP